MTICAWQRECVFGEINDGRITLNEFGGIAEACLKAIPKHFQYVDIDETVIMPNHVHLILTIYDDGRGTACRAPTKEQFAKPVPNSIPTIIRSFKSAVTRQIHISRNTQGRPVWQSNYYEHVIRNEKELFVIRRYIRDNLLNWDKDENNPVNIETVR